MISSDPLRVGYWGGLLLGLPIVFLRNTDWTHTAILLGINRFTRVKYSLSAG